MTRLDEACAPAVAHAIDPDEAATIAHALKALSDPLRLRMLSVIANDPRGECCVCDLAALADVSQPTISHHLKVLRSNGILLSERRGTWVYYRIDPARRAVVSTLLDAFATAATLDTSGDDETEHAEAPPAMDGMVSRLAEELADEWSGTSRDLVTVVVRECYASLLRSAKPTRSLIPLTECFARQRLTDITRDREATVPQVLFVCVHNAGRSQLAAALLNQLSKGRVLARSAGSAPAAEVHPRVLPLITQIIGERDAEPPFPKPLTDDAVRAADVVVTMGCGDVCPIIPGVRYEDWVVGDPALASAEGVAAIRNDIERRVRELLGTLLAD